MPIHRPLAPTEVATLHEELKSTPNILGYSVRELLAFRDVLVAEVEGEFAGVCISKDLRFGWTDIAVLYVLPDVRGKGIATELYTEAWRRAKDRGRHIVTLSRSPAVIHLMERFGMEISGSMMKAPLAFHLYMNGHMMNWYRVREAIRKMAHMKTEHAMQIGIQRSIMLKRPGHDC